MPLMLLGQVKISQLPTLADETGLRQGYLPIIWNGENYKAQVSNLRLPADTNTVTKATVSFLRTASTENLSIKVIYATPDGGLWQVDESDNSSSDNTGTVLVNGSTRVKRIYSGPVNVKWFGAKGDNSTDDAAALNAINTAGIADVYFPPGIYKTSTTVTFATANVTMENAQIVYTGTKDQPILVLGTNSAKSTGKTYSGINVKASSVSASNWADEDFVGVLAIRHYSSRFQIANIQFCARGLKVYGDGGGVVYNQFEFGNILDNYIGVELSTNNGGWCNENLFFNGEFQCTSTSSSFGKRYGLRLTSTEEYYLNNNYFLKPSFELGSSQGTPVWMEYGNYNKIVSARDEGNGDTCIYEQNNSAANEYEFYNTGGALVNTSLYPSSSKTERQSAHRVTTPVIYNSGNLAKKTVPYNSTDINTADVHFAVNNSATPLINGATFTYTDDYITVPHQRGVGVFVNTEKRKSFVVSPVLFGGTKCRIVIVPYDSSGNRITTSNTVRSSNNSNVVFTTNWGGGWSTGSAFDFGRFFSVTDSTKYVRVILYNVSGDGETKLIGFSISDVSRTVTGGSTWWTGLESVGAASGINLATEAPASGTFSAGRKAYKYQPVSGDPTGWVYNGSAWLPFGLVGQPKRTAVANTAYTILTTDYLIAYTALTATRAVTLPTASSVAGQHFIIKDEAGTAGSNAITIVGTVNGASNPTAVNANYGVYKFYSNGTAYFSE